MILNNSNIIYSICIPKFHLKMCKNCDKRLIVNKLTYSRHASIYLINCPFYILIMLSFKFNSFINNLKQWRRYRRCSSFQKKEKKVAEK